jgi:phosphoserine phosphatase RsbU/P
VKAVVRAGRELAVRRPLPELFRVILDLSMEAVGAERGVLLTLAGDRLVVQAYRGEGFRISTAVRDKVLQERVSLLVQDAQQDQELRGRESILIQNVHALMAVPLQTDECVLGLVYVDSPLFVRQFSSDDLDLLTVIANAAAMRIERERLVEVEQARQLLINELEQAAEIQRQFLPACAPRVRGLDLAAYIAPCRTVGGDYYDFLPYPDGKVALVVGDVAGKGIPAALLMVSLQARVQALVEDTSDPAEFVGRLNRSILSTCPRDRFISLFLCVVDPQNGDLVYCNAGHNPPLLARRGGEVKRLEEGGPVLGVLPRLDYKKQYCHLEFGDVIVLYSDGVTEAISPSAQMFGEEKLVRILQEKRHEPADLILKAVNQAVQDWIGEAPATDDITLMVARRTE